MRNPPNYCLSTGSIPRLSWILGTARRISRSTSSAARAPVAGRPSRSFKLPVTPTSSTSRAARSPGRRAGLPVVRGQEVDVPGAAGADRRRVARRGRHGVGGVRASGLPRPGRLRRGWPGLRRGHGHLRDGDDPGEDALESGRQGERPTDETRHRGRGGRGSLGGDPSPPPLRRLSHRPLRAGAGRLLRQLRPALLRRRRDRGPGQAPRRDPRADAGPLQPRRAGPNLRRGDRPGGEDGPSPRPGHRVGSTTSPTTS